MTRRFHRDDVVTTGHSRRTWTVRRVDGEMATLRDDRGVLCSAPVASLWLVRSPARWPIRIATGAVFAFAAICVSCIWRVVVRRIELDYVTSAILLSIASVSVLAWMILLLRGVWNSR